MGIDFLDLSFRVEKHFKVKFSAQDSTAAACQHNPPDVAAGELFDILLAKGPRLRCRACKNDLAVHGRSGTCAKCGMPFDAWEEWR